ncbi:uncharacterized protein METZ01_LOCUS368208, partial [marine metagenome]
MLTDLSLAHLFDRTQSKWGHRRPAIVSAAASIQGLTSTNRR